MRCFRLSPLVVVMVLLLALPATAAPKADLWERWTAHDPASTQQVDHSAWTTFLDTYLKVDPNGLNRLDYAGVTDADKKALDAYVELLSETPVSILNRDVQYAYWLNFYNALTVQVILDHMPVDSIMDIDISPGLFAQGPWGKKLVMVEGEEVSLDDMEHRILRPIWRDPRIHYGVNCASVGCPDLVTPAYDPTTLDAVLTANAIAYVNSPRGVTVKGDDIIVSKIYDWFIEDFDNNKAGVLKHLKQYAQGATKEALERINDIDDHEYDWSLNDLDPS